MIRSNLTVCATGSSLDRLTNRVSLFNLLEDINVVGFPTILPEVSIALFLERDAGDPDTFEMNAVFKCGAFVGPSPNFRVDFSGATKVKTVVTLQNAFISTAGEWEVAVMYAGRPVGRYVFQVNVVGQAVAANVALPEAAPNAPEPPH